MAYIRKAFLKCDKCRTVEETSSLDGDPFSVLGKDEKLVDEGWISTERGVHLCPKCAKPYLEKKKQFEHELSELSGKSHIELDL